MSDDLIKALQKEAREDAEIITRLRAENKKLREALKKAEITLSTASRILTQGHEFVLKGKVWGQSTLKIIRAALGENDGN